MLRSYAYQPYNKVDYYPRDDGSAIVYLHDNMEETENEDGSITYSAEELEFKTQLTKEEIEENFDTIWVEQALKSESLEDRVSKIELVLGAIVDDILGV